MYAIVREILLYTFFVLVTFSISYSLREERGFWQTYGLEQLFKLPTDPNNEFKANRFSAVSRYAINPLLHYFLLYWVCQQLLKGFGGQCKKVHGRYLKPNC